MANDRPPWHVPHHPDPDYAFFISHVSEDTEVVTRLKAGISGRSGRGGAKELRCFLDSHNWPIGNVNRLMIREYLRRSQFMIAWVTPSYIQNLRGWIWFELCYAELLELSLQDWPNVEPPFLVPIFQGVTIKQIERTPLWQYWQRRIAGPGTNNRIEAIAQRVVDFHAQEMRRRPPLPPVVPL